MSPPSQLVLKNSDCDILGPGAKYKNTKEGKRDGGRLQEQQEEIKKGESALFIS